MNVHVHKAVVILCKNRTKSFKILSAIIRINTEGKSLL